MYSVVDFYVPSRSRLKAVAGAVDHDAADSIDLDMQTSMARLLKTFSAASLFASVHDAVTGITPSLASWTPPGSLQAEIQSLRSPAFEI